LYDDEFGDDGGDGDVNDQTKSDPLSTLLNEENSAKKAINDNIDEINMLPMFCGVPDLTAPAVMLGIKIKQFKGISRDQLAVCGLSGIDILYFHKNNIYHYNFYCIFLDINSLNLFACKIHFYHQKNILLQFVHKMHDFQQNYIIKIVIIYFFLIKIMNKLRKFMSKYTIEIVIL